MDLDLALARALRGHSPTYWPVLLAGAVARQATSPTAVAQARLPRPPAPGHRFGPADGRFGAITSGAASAGGDG